MKISDLQHIETTNEAEVKGAGFTIRPFNQAGAGASAEAFGYNTKAFTNTGTLVIEGQYSGSGSDSYSESF